MKTELNLDPFTRAYIEAALWSSTDNSDPETGGDPLDKNYGPEDFTDEALDRIAADCAKFQSENETPDYGERGASNGGDAACAGHDFWLTRNGHGVGFWDRDELSEEDQTRLTKAAKAFGQCDIYVGDDGKLHIY